MANNSFSPTYKTLLTLQRHDLTLRAGLCLSQVGFEELRATCYNFLHPKERLYFSGLAYPKRQHSYLLGRYCAKQAIAAYTNLDTFTDVSIESGIFHQPVVNHPNYRNVQVSISHTSALGAALTFPEAHPMAIDIEEICMGKVDVIKSQLSLAEQKLGFFAEEVLNLSLLWTAKEALSKVLKCGLMISFDLLEVEAVTQQGNATISYFKNFKQYQTLSFLLDTAVCSLVYPLETCLTLDILDIQRSLGSFSS
jgi:4'-phosphopantetheinyl transferase EntD